MSRDYTQTFYNSFEKKIDDNSGRNSWEIFEMI